MPRGTDVAVVGAGSAGAAVALLCARRGLSVVCIERRELSRAGPGMVNDLPASCFDAIGVARPDGDELVSQGNPFHLVAGWGPAKVVVRDHDGLSVDMRRLVARLQTLARKAGVRMLGRVEARAIDGETIRTSGGDLRARFIVDAAGFSEAITPATKAPIRTRDVCATAHAVHSVRSMDGASAYFAIHGAVLGETVCFIGIAGGYSVLHIRLAGGAIRMLAASIPGDGQPSGRALLRTFVAQNSWIGEATSGGSRVIPLGAVGAPLACGNVARIGDAGHHVFSAHGSGAAGGLFAAQILADALASGDGVRGYDVAWQRRFGALNATSQALRRFTQRLTSDDIARMMRCGLVSEETVRAGLEQRWPRRSVRTLAPLARSVRWPTLAWAVVALVVQAIVHRVRWGAVTRAGYLAK